MKQIWSEPILGASLKSECIPCGSHNFSIKTMCSNNTKHLWPPQMESDFINSLLQYTGIPINWQSIRYEMKKITGRELSETQLFNKYSKSLRADYKNFSAVLTEKGVGWECLVSHESWVEYLQKIPEQAQAFNKKGHQYYMLLHDLFNQKAATNLGQKRKSDSIDSSESCKRVKGPSSSVEVPSRKYSVAECINVLRTLSLNPNFYVDAVSHLLKKVYHRVEFLRTAEVYKMRLLMRYIGKANKNDPRNKENPTNRPP